MRTKETVRGLCGALSLSVGIAVAQADISKDRSAEQRWSWVTDRQPMLADVTGDGVEDLVGWVRDIADTGASSVRLAAVDGASGRRLWASPAIDRLQYAKAALVGDRVLLGDSAGALTAFSAHDGRAIWSAPLGERVARFCGEGVERVRVEKTDGFAVLTTLATGELAPVGKADHCAGIWTDERGRTPFVYATDELKPEIVGLSVDKTIVDANSRAHVAIGSRKAGTRVPMAARYAAPPTTGDRYPKVKALWLSPIPAVDPLTVLPEDAQFATLSSDRLIAPYRLETDKASWRLACLDLETGRNLWDVAVPFSEMQNRRVDWILATADKVFVGLIVYTQRGRSGDLYVYTEPGTIAQVFDSATGLFLTTLGAFEPSLKATNGASEPSPHCLTAQKESVIAEESQESLDDPRSPDDAPMAGVQTELRDAQTPQWSIPDGTKLMLTLMSTSRVVGDPVVARIERAAGATGLPDGSVFEGRVAQVKHAGSLGRGFLTVVFDRIAMGGRGLTQTMTPVAAEFKYGGRVAWLNRAIVVGLTAGGAAYGVATTKNMEGLPLASFGFLSYGLMKEAQEPALTQGERRTVKVRRPDRVQR